MASEIKARDQATPISVADLANSIFNDLTPEQLKSLQLRVDLHGLVSDRVWEEYNRPDIKYADMEVDLTNISLVGAVWDLLHLMAGPARRQR
jgi:hypothetical protein